MSVNIPYMDLMGYGSGFLVSFQKPPNHGLLQLTPDPQNAKMLHESLPHWNRGLKYHLLTNKFQSKFPTLPKFG